MSTYKISRIIQSAIWLSETCEVDGIRFEPVVPLESDQLLVSETIRADSYRDASSQFDRHLLTVVDAITVVMGAALAPLGGSTLIEKTRSKYIYLHAVIRRASGHLTLIPSHHGELIGESSTATGRLIAHAPLRHAAHYLRQAAVAENVRTSTFQTLQAAEALCGRGGRTDYSALKAAIGEEAYQFFYVKDPLLGEKRRAALAHGRLIEEEGLVRVTSKLQERLLEALRKDVGGGGFPALSPVHGFATFEATGRFLEPLSELPPYRRSLTPLAATTSTRVRSSLDRRPTLPTACASLVTTATSLGRLELPEEAAHA
jgi:hypothetical protein